MTSPEKPDYSSWRYSDIMEYDCHGYDRGVLWGFCFDCGHIEQTREEQALPYWYCNCGTNGSRPMPWQQTLPLVPWCRVPTKAEFVKWCRARTPVVTLRLKAP